MTNQIPRDLLHIRSCTPYTIQCTAQIQKYTNTEIQIQPLIWLFKTPGLHCTSDAVQKMSLHFRRVPKCNIVLSIIWTVCAVFGCSEFIEDCAVLSFRQYVPVCSCSAVCSFRCQMFFPEGRTTNHLLSDHWAERASSNTLFFSQHMTNTNTNTNTNTINNHKYKFKLPAYSLITSRSKCCTFHKPLHKIL